MKKLLHGLWSFGLLSLAFGQAPALHAESDAGEDIQPSFGFFDSDAFAGRSAIISQCEGKRQSLNPYGLAKRVSSWSMTVRGESWLKMLTAIFFGSSRPIANPPTLGSGMIIRPGIFSASDNSDHDAEV